MLVSSNILNPVKLIVLSIILSKMICLQCLVGVKSHRKARYSSLQKSQGTNKVILIARHSSEWTFSVIPIFWMSSYSSSPWWIGVARICSEYILMSISRIRNSNKWYRVWVAKFWFIYFKVITYVKNSIPLRNTLWKFY